MEIIASHYDPDIMQQDSDDLLEDLDAIRANLRRTDLRNETRISLVLWQHEIIAVLVFRGVFPQDAA